MNLKTHNAYPEIDISPHNIASIKFIDAKGDVKFEDMVAGKTNSEVRQKARTVVEQKAPEYLKGEK